MKKRDLALCVIGVVTLAGGVGLHYSSSGAWRIRHFNSQEEAQKAAKQWIDDGGTYRVSVERKEMVKELRPQNVVEDEVYALMELEETKRKACYELLKKSIDEYSSCMGQLFEQKVETIVPKHKLVENVVVDERQQSIRECIHLGPGEGYACGETAIRPNKLVSEREARLLKAKKHLHYFRYRDTQTTSESPLEMRMPLPLRGTG